MSSKNKGAEDAITALENDSSLNQSLKLPDGEIISFATAGPSNGIPIFTIPGLGNHRTILALFRPFAIQNNLFFINMDRPGCGKSRCCSSSATADHSKNQKKDLNKNRIRRVISNSIALMKHLDIISSPIHIMGHSCGAVYALCLASELNNLGTSIVKNVFLMSPWISLSHSNTSSFLRGVRKLPRFMIFAGVNSMTSVNTMFFKSVSIDDVLREGYSERERELFKGSRRFRKCFEASLNLAAKEDQGGGAADAVFALEKVERFPEWDVVGGEDLKGVNVEVFHGDRDNMVPLEAVTSTLPDVRIITDGTHHLLFDMCIWRGIVKIIHNKEDDNSIVTS